MYMAFSKCIDRVTYKIKKLDKMIEKLTKLKEKCVIKSNAYALTIDCNNFNFFFNTCLTNFYNAIKSEDLSGLLHVEEELNLVMLELMELIKTVKKGKYYKCATQEEVLNSYITLLSSINNDFNNLKNYVDENKDKTKGL